MTFRDVQLQQRYERALIYADGCPGEQLPVLALMHSWHWFHRIEGAASPRAAEAIEHLLSPVLSPELRPALRLWYHRAGDNLNENATRFRERLSELAGERFG